MKTLNLRKGQKKKGKEPDPGGSDQQNLGYKQLKNRKADRTVGLNYIYFSNISSGTAWLLLYPGTCLMRVPSRFFGIRDLAYLKAGIRDFVGKGERDSGL